MDRCQHGDETAFSDLVRRYSNMLFGYLVRLCGSREDAQDLFQETFLRVHTRSETFRSGATFKPWLFGIATHAAYDWLRRRKRRMDSTLVDDLDPAVARAHEPATPPSSDPPNLLIKDERRAQVQKAIQTLPDQQRTALVLAYYQDLPYREVAEVMGCSLGTVKTHMSRALASLARILPDPQKELL